MIGAKIKILVLGIGQSNFLNALYGAIIMRDNSFDFKIDVLSHLPNDSHNQSIDIFSERFNFNFYIKKLSSLKKNLIFVKQLPKSFFIEVFFFELSQTKSIKKALQMCKRLALKKYIYNKYIVVEYFDVVHFHFCTRSNLEYLHFIGKESKVICSFWGSDLWRASNIRDNYYVSKALNNANIITAQTPEMALALKAKYGIHLSDKIKDVRFTISTAIYDAINIYRNDVQALQEFRQQYNLLPEKLVVALGHNAFQENNHLQLIEAMSTLPMEFKNKVIFVLHLSYGRVEDYLKILKHQMKNAIDLEFKIIEDFMNPEEIAKLRLVTDVMIHAPISDALSGTMTEVLYAGNKVVTGGWLSFGILRRNGIYFDEFEKFDQLSIKLVEVLANVKLDLHQRETNKRQIESFLFPDKTSNDWITLFKESTNE